MKTLLFLSVVIKNPASIKNTKNQITVQSFIKIAGGYYKGAYTSIIYFPIRNISKICSRGHFTFMGKNFPLQDCFIKTSVIKTTTLKKEENKTITLFNLIIFFY